MEYDFLTWLGHASFLIKTKGLSIFIDPYNIGNFGEKADLIFITHAHRDHFEEETISRIANGNTSFVAPADVIKKIGSKRGVAVKPGEKGEILGIKYETIAAYNVDPEKLGFHKKESNWVGFILEIEGKRIYHPGDTDLIEEMKTVHADLALIPCGGKFAMDIDEAIEATKIIDAKNFAPIHYRNLVGEEGAKKLKKKFVESVRGAILLKEHN